MSSLLPWKRLRISAVHFLLCIVLLSIGALLVNPPAYDAKSGDFQQNLAIFHKSFGGDVLQPTLENKEDISPRQSSDDWQRVELPVCQCQRFYQADLQKSNSLVRSSCSAASDLRGTGQKVVSFSFYGRIDSRYFKGIEANAARIREIYPNWVMRVYHNLCTDQHNNNNNHINHNNHTHNNNNINNNNNYNNINNNNSATNINLCSASRNTRQRNRRAICDISCRFEHVDFCNVIDLKEPPNLAQKFGMIWRFLPLGDPTVERFIVRDLDSIVSQREVDAVEDWIRSGRSFHAMRDHPQHGTEILGGLWGGFNKFPQQFHRIRQHMFSQARGHFKGLDQRLLTRVLWPLVVQLRDIVVHDSYLCHRFPMSRAFPSRRIGAEFVGQVTTVSQPTKESKESAETEDLKESKESTISKMVEDSMELKSMNHSVTVKQAEYGRALPCPYTCRPRHHKDWLYC